MKNNNLMLVLVAAIVLLWCNVAEAIETSRIDKLVTKFEKLNLYLLDTVPNQSDPYENLGQLNKKYKQLGISILDRDLDHAIGLLLKVTDVSQKDVCTDKALGALKDVSAALDIGRCKQLRRLCSLVEHFGAQMASRCIKTYDDKIKNTLLHMDAEKPAPLFEIINDKLVSEYQHDHPGYLLPVMLDKDGLLTDYLTAKIDQIFKRSLQQKNAKKLSYLLQKNTRGSDEGRRHSYIGEFKKYFVVPCKYYASEMKPVIDAGRAMSRYSQQFYNDDDLVQRLSNESQRAVFRYKFCRSLLSRKNGFRLDLYTEFQYEFIQRHLLKQNNNSN